MEENISQSILSQNKKNRTSALSKAKLLNPKYNKLFGSSSSSSLLIAAANANENSICDKSRAIFLTSSSSSSSSAPLTSDFSSNFAKARTKNGKSITRPFMLKTTTNINSAHRYCTSIVTLLTLIVVVLLNNFNFGIYANAAFIGGSKTSDSGNSFFQIIPETTNGDPQQQQQQQYRNLPSSTSTNNFDQRHHIARRAVTETPLKLTGLRVEASNHEIEYNDDGVPGVKSIKDTTIRIFGSGITPFTVIAFTTQANDVGGSCLLPSTPIFKPEEGSVTGSTARYNIVLPKEKNMFYLCAKNDENYEQVNSNATKPLVHQGRDSALQINSYEDLLPVWVSICIIFSCLCFSALFSGLNLGLMSMDRTELKILCNTGSDKEREYARKIQPVRNQGNYLLCSILLGNVLVNSIFTILLDGLTSGLFAVIFSTLAIVIFGEITPQAVCSRHGLAIGAKTIFITKAVMILTFPLAYPISKFLDYMLGEEIGNVYNRERLKELVKVTTGINDLDKNEVNIISGALELRKKTVADVMTRIDDAFMLPLDALLDFETVSEIMKSGFSRVPVYDGERKNIVTLLYIKDLAFVDTDDNTPLRTLCEFYQNPVHFVFEDATLDVMFNQFKDGTIGHIAFVHRVNNEGDGDPFYETIGLVTLEDVIEELIQAEIVDETDVFVDNRTKVRRNRNKKQDFTVFAERRENQAIRISPQLILATFQYLSTTVDAFKKENVSETILRRLLNQDIVHTIKCKGKDKDDPSLFIYQQGKAVDFFVLILEGRVEVTVGKENLLFESGPFTYFGIQALSPNVVPIESPTQPMGSLQSLNMDSKIRQTFAPDYSVRAATDVTYITIKRNLYLTAKKATLLEKTRRSGVEPSSETIDDEVEKLLHSLHDDDKFHVRGSQSMRKISAANNGGSNTISPSLNDMSSHQSVSKAASPVNWQNSIENGSIHSQITSEPASEPNSSEHHGTDKDDAATTAPLLPKVLDDIKFK